MGNIGFACPHCNNRLLIDEQYAGYTVNCPKCGAQTIVPAPPPGSPIKGPAQNMGALPPPPLPPGPVAPRRPIPPPVPRIPEKGLGVQTPLIRALDFLLGGMGFLDRYQAGFRKYQTICGLIGVYATLVAGGLFFIFSIISAVKGERPSLLGTGFAGLFVALVLHYIAGKFSNSASTVMLKEDKMPPRAVVNCLGLIAFTAAIGILIAGIVDAVTMEDGEPLYMGIAGFFILGHLAFVFLNPFGCLNMRSEVAEPNAGTTGLTILVYAYRVLLAMAPSVIAFGTVAAVIAMLVNMLMFLGGDRWAAYRFHEAVGAVVVLALMPFLFYLIHVLYMLVVDLCRAIFQIAHNTKHEKE